MSEPQVTLSFIDALAKLAPVGTNLLLLSATVVLWLSYKKDQALAREELKEMNKAYHAQTAELIKVLTELSEKVE